jgi:pyruvate formate lyase activating enzyme
MFCDSRTYEVEDEIINCYLCHQRCSIKNGENGFCNVRKNIDNKLVLSNYGYTVACVIDTLEKRPIRNYVGPNKSLTLGLKGCNNRCNFCQNYKIAYGDYDRLNYLSPEDVIKKGLENNIDFISFTYTEPLIWFEYIVDIAKLAKKHNIKICVKTSGNIDSFYCDWFVEYVDVFNVDIKPINLRWRDENKIEFVDMSFILNILKFGKHIELTYVVIDEFLSEIDDTIEYLSKFKNIPLHLVRQFQSENSPYKTTDYNILLDVYNKFEYNGFKKIYRGI